MNLNSTAEPVQCPPTRKLKHGMRRCSVCGGGHSDMLYRRQFARISNGLLDGYDVVACSDCGFCFADDLPPQAAFDAYYERQSKYEHNDRSGKQSEFDTRRRPFTVGIISKWLPDRNATVLDIGCANGDLLAEMRKQGYHNVRGVDPSPSCARNAKDLYGIDVVTAPISRIPDGIGRFDLVILASVLEHILDFKGTLARLRKLLKPGGCVFVEVPDMTRCSLMKDAAFQEFSLEHINYFSPISLANLWTQHGFQTVDIRQTEIDQIPGLTLYEIKAIFRLTDPDAPRNISPDTQTRAELERYIRSAQAKLDHIETVIDELADSQRPIIVWGVGTLTQSLLATTRLKGANIQAFVDSNNRYASQKLHGIPILPVSTLVTRSEPILVASQQFQTEIVQQIQSVFQLSNPVITLF